MLRVVVGVGERAEEEGTCEDLCRLRGLSGSSMLRWRTCEVEKRKWELGSRRVGKDGVGGWNVVRESPYLGWIERILL